MKLVPFPGLCKPPELITNDNQVCSGRGGGLWISARTLRARGRRFAALAFRQQLLDGGQARAHGLNLTLELPLHRIAVVSHADTRRLRAWPRFWGYEFPPTHGVKHSMRRGAVCANDTTVIKRAVGLARFACTLVGSTLRMHCPDAADLMHQPNLDAMLAARATEIAAAEGGIQQRVMALLVAGYTAGNVAIPMQLDSITYTRAQVRALEQYGIPGYLGTHQISDGGMPGHDESTYLFL